MANLESVLETARMLRDHFGAEAINVASKRQRKAIEEGRENEANDWERVRKVLRESRGPVES